MLMHAAYLFTCKIVNAVVRTYVRGTSAILQLCTHVTQFSWLGHAKVGNLIYASRCLTQLGKRIGTPVALHCYGGCSRPIRFKALFTICFPYRPERYQMRATSVDFIIRRRGDRMPILTLPLSRNKNCTPSCYALV